MTAPLAYLAGRNSLIESLLAGVVCTALTIVLYGKNCEMATEQRWYAVLQCVFLSFTASSVLRMAGATWPEAQKNPIVILTLLLIAYWGSREGAVRASRASAVLMWFLVILYGAVVAGGIGNIRVDRIDPADKTFTGLPFFVYLLPGISVFIPREREKEHKLWLIPLFGTIISILVTGTLSAKLAESLENPFYEFGKSLSLFGVVERFESFVSVALMIGYYCMLSLILSASYHLCENAVIGSGKQGILLTATASGLLADISVGSFYLLAIGGLLLWYILPVIMHNWGVRK